MKKFGGHQTKVTEQLKQRGRQALRFMVKQDKRSRDIRGIEGRLWSENASARPYELRENAYTDTSSGQEEMA